MTVVGVQLLKDAVSVAMVLAVVLFTVKVELYREVVNGVEDVVVARFVEVIVGVRVVVVVVVVVVVRVVLVVD